jgi:hypothetical protein
MRVGVKVAHKGKGLTGGDSDYFGVLANRL